MLSRRNFLKGCVAGSGAAVAALAPAPANARGNLTKPPGGLGLVYDATLGVGCQACVAACKEANNKPPEFRTADRLWDTPLDTWLLYTSRGV